MQMTVSMDNSERKLQDLLDRAVKEGEQNGLTINYKNTENTVISKTKSPTCKLQITDLDIKQVRNFKYLGSVLADDGKCVPKSESPLE